MGFKQVSILFSAIFIWSFTITNDLSKKVDKEIKATFGVENYTYAVKVIPDAVLKELPSEFNNENLLSIIDNDVFLGYAYFGQGFGKTDHFDFLVLFNSELSIVKTKVLAYREDYGGEIGSKRWLKQFIGKTQYDNLKYGDDIVAISGATISVRSMTNEINNLLKSLRILHSKNIL